MAKRLQFRGGTTTQHSTFTGANREITIDTDKHVPVVHDGVTPGGHELQKALTTEQTEALEKIEGLEASASEIDGSVNKRHMNLLGENFYNVEQNKSLFDLSTWTITTAGSGTPILENDTSIIKFSDKSLKFGNTTAGAQATKTDIRKVFTTPYDLSDIDGITIWVHVPTQHVADGKYSSDYGEVRIYFSNSAGSIGIGAKFISLNTSLQVGWNNVFLPKTLFDIPIGTGLLDWSSVEAIRMQFNTGVGNIGTPIYIDSIFAGRQTVNKVPICITLDDSTVDTYYLANIMNQYGIPVSSFVIPSLIDIEGATSYLRLHQVKDMYNRGNHIGIHDTGINAFSVNPSRILIVRDWLINNGFTRDDGHLYGTYPNGSYSQETIDLCKANGIKGFRQVFQRMREDADNVEEAKGKNKFEPFLNGGIAEPLKISGERPATYAEFVANIDKAITLQQCYLPYFHLFTEVGGRTEWVKFAKYLRTKIDAGLIECLTFPQFCKKYSN
jgi:hypothetical protein